MKMVKATAFAAAALAAGVAMAEVESSNICGYVNKASEGAASEFVPGDYNMIAPCFITVGSEGDEAGISLAELAVGGYTKIEDDGDGCEGGMVITMLSPRGITKTAMGLDGEKHDVIYTWFDVGEDLPAAWYDNDVQPLVSEEQAEAWDKTQSYWGDAKDVKFAPGEGFRLMEDSLFSGLYLTVAGEVRKIITTFDAFVPGDYVSLGNPTPTVVPLSAIWVDGYTKIEDDGDGCEGGMVITMLSTRGITKTATGSDGEKHDVIYTWFDVGEDLPAAWYDNDVQPMVSEEQAEAWDKTQSYWGDAKDIKFAPGDAFRCMEDSLFSGLSLNFPSPIKK